MKEQVHFFVNGVHSVGGVTTWSCQAAKQLAAPYDTDVVAVSVDASDDMKLFPGEVRNIFRKPTQRNAQGPQNEQKSQNDQRPHGSKKPLKELPTKPSKPVRKEKKVRKSTRPAKPIKPTKKPIEPPRSSIRRALIATLHSVSQIFGHRQTKSAPQKINGKHQSFQVQNGKLDTSRSNCDQVAPPAAQQHLHPLHPTAQEVVDDATLFVPNYVKFAYDLAARSRLAGRPSRCIGICHCDQDNYYQLLRHYAPIINSFVAVSPRCRRRLIEILPDRESDIYLIPYGVAPPPRDFSFPNRTTGPIRLLYSGRLNHHQKRIFDLVKIADRLEALQIEYQMDIVGVGPDRSALQERMKKFDRVQFLPGVSHNNISEVYKDHDVFLLPSETEGTSIALLESMAHGLVPIVTRVSGSEDVVIDGENGFLTEVGDIPQIVKSIQAVVDCDQRRMEMAGLARKTISQNYNIQTQLELFENCVQETLNKSLSEESAAISVLNGDPYAQPLTATGLPC